MLSPRRIGLVLLAVLLGLGSTAEPVVAQAERGLPLMVQYGRRDYGAHVQNWAFERDARGVLYVGNGEGVLRFDGSTWAAAPMRNGGFVRSLARGADGAIYVGGQNEIGRLDPHAPFASAYRVLAPAHPDSSASFGDVWKTHVVGESVVFVTPEALLTWRDGALRRRTVDPPIHTSFRLSDGLYVRQWDRGLARVEADALPLVPGGERFADERVYGLVEPAPGELLAATRTQGFQHFDGQRWRRVPSVLDAEWADLVVYDLAQSPTGTLLLGTRAAGLVELDADLRVLRRLDAGSGLRDATVNVLTPQPDGVVWVGLNDGFAGVDVGAPISVFDERLGLRGIVLAVQRFGDTIYAGTTVGLFRLAPASGGTTARFEPVDAFDGEVFALLTTERGLLVGTRSGVVAWDGRRGMLAHEGDTNTLARGEGETVLIGDTDGAWMMRPAPGGGWSASERMPGTEGLDVRGIEAEPGGEVWLSAWPGGVFWRREAGARVVPVPDVAGAYAAVVRLGDTVYASQDDGLHRLEDGGAEAEPTHALLGPDDAPLRGLRRLAAGPDGRIWGGLPDRTGELVRRPDGSAQWREGWLSRLPRAAAYALLPEAEATWVGGDDGLMRIENDAIEPPAGAGAAPLVEAFVADSLRGVFHAAVTATLGAVPRAERSIRFAFVAPVLLDNDRVEYRARLDGFGEPWSRWSRRTEREYTNLPPGTYAFEVEARDALGRIGRSRVAGIEVLPAWWQTYWAMALFALVLSGAGYGVHLFQRRRLLRKERERSRQLENELRADAAEAWASYLAAEHQRATQELESAREIQLSMLPHEVPRRPGLDIAAHMTTATEVGGDYYDFYLGPDDALTCIVGDATGHGARAGVMVTATKSLWNAFAHEPSLVHAVGCMHRALRATHLSRLYMAVGILRIRGDEIELVGAGLPPALLHRGRTGEVVSIPLKGVPLGGPMRPRPALQKVRWEPGDTLLVMSDGFPELRAPDGRLFGFEEVEAFFASLRPTSADDVIAEACAAIDAWRGDEAPSDDITLLALRCVPLPEPSTNGARGALLERVSSGSGAPRP